MRARFLEKIAFVVSLAVLAWLYGFATSARGWFPNDFLVRAWTQAEAIFAPPPPSFTAPRVYERQGVSVADPEAVQPGATLVSSYWESSTWQPGLKLIDTRGRVLHEWLFDVKEIFSDSIDRPGDLQGSHLFPDGDVLVNFAYVGTVRFDACGDVVWRLQEGSHHSIARAEDGTFWIPAYGQEAPAASASHPEGLPGLPESVGLDLILRVTPDGDVVSTIDVLDLLYRNGLERHIAKSHRLKQPDVTHLNDVEPLYAALAPDFPLFEAGDLLVSLRNLDLVFVVDPESDIVKWNASEPFIEQHDPDFLEDGWIGVFDNNRDGTDRGSMLGGSRILALRPDDDSVTQLFPTSESDPFYTEYAGKWQTLANGNLLLTESAAGRVVEADANGRTVWEWIHQPYDESRVPEVYESTRYELTAEQVASWPCSNVGPTSRAGDTALRP